MRVDIIETNAPALKHTGTVKFDIDGVVFAGSSPFKSSLIPYSSMAGVEEVESDKHYTTAKIFFDGGLFFTFKVPTEAYLKNIKHKNYANTTPCKIVERTSPLAVWLIVIVVLGVFGLFFGQSNRSSSQQSTSSKVSTKNTQVAQGMIQRAGYRCDSVSYISQSPWDGSYRVTCNDDNYAYSIDDVGGNWVVTSK